MARDIAEGRRDEAIGSLKQGAGKVLRNDELASEGAAQRERGSISRRAD